MRPLIVVILVAGPVTMPARAADPVDYDRDIRPILSNRCFACHGAGKRRGGLRLDEMSYLHLGGDRGPAIIKGSATGSLLVKAIAGSDPNVPAMPPKGARLTSEEVSLIRTWIDQGSHGPVSDTVKRTKGHASDHWAFRSVVRPPVPPVRDVSSVRNADRPIHPHPIREATDPTRSRGGPADFAASVEPGPDRAAADARRCRRFHRRRWPECLRAERGTAPGLAGLRRAMGEALAGRRCLRG